MGRIRTIKPEIFTHGLLFDLEKETGMPMRVAWMGMLTCCDREGRFKWRPRELKIAVLPYDEVDFSRVLDVFASRGFLVKYEVDGETYGYIPTWKDHQFINGKEAASIIPEPPKNKVDGRVDDAKGTCDSREKHTLTTDGVKERKGKEEEGASGTRDYSIASRVLSEKVGNHDIRFQEEMTRLLKALPPDKDLESEVEFMASQWAKYNLSRTSLNFPVQSSEKFFRSSIWQDEKLWPWKEGQQPKPKRIYVNGAA